MPAVVGAWRAGSGTQRNVRVHPGTDHPQVRVERADQVKPGIEQPLQHRVHGVRRPTSVRAWRPHATPPDAYGQIYRFPLLRVACRRRVIDARDADEQTPDE